MNTWSESLQPWANVIVPTLLHFLWQGALVGVLAAVMGMVLRRSAPSVRYAASLGLFAVMAAAPLVTATILFSGVPLVLPGPSSPVEATPSVPLHWQSQWHAEDGSRALVDMLTAWQPFVLFAWLVGVALCSLRLTGGLIWYGWLSRRLEPIPQEFTVVVRRLSQRLGLSASVRVMLSRDVREPLAMRIIQPLIVLPASWLLSAPPLVVEAVLAHELAHIRRHDLWVNLLQRVVETLLFFHPAVWWLSRQIRRERELCCDMLAVAATGRAVEYAQALEAVARFRLEWSSPAMAAGMGGDRMALLERVRRVLGLETASETGWWPVGLAGLFLAAVCGTGVFFSSAPVQGDEDQPKISEKESTEKANEDKAADLARYIDQLIEAVADEDGERSPRREGEGDRPRPPRDGDRRDPPPRGDGDRPVEPRREGDRGPQPRDDDRRPEERQRYGAPRPQPEGDWRPGPDERGRPQRGPTPEGDVMHELLMTIRELRQEVQMLREEVRSIRGPRPGDGPREGNDFRPRSDAPGRSPGPDARRLSEDDFRRDAVREGRGPQPRREGDGRPRGADAAPARGPGPDGRDLPPRGENRDASPRPEGPPRGDVPREERRFDDGTPKRPEAESKPAEPDRKGF